jgi:hypothetical protein
VTRVINQQGSMLELLVKIVATAIATVLSLAAMRPDTFRVQRSAGIKAPREKIFPLIDNLRACARWLPYFTKDPALKGAYSGPNAGSGAQFEFDGNRDVGSGRLTITDSKPPDTVRMRRQMFKRMSADNVVDLTLVPNG